VINRLHIEEFLNQSLDHPVIDVRSPAEFRHAHWPGSISLPLFSNEERAVIGTLYKQHGREPAMMKGLQYYGANMQRIISDLKNHTTDRQIFVYCWRGGMRSGVVSWMLDLFGYKVSVLIGGYKSFRKYVLENFSSERPLLILGGRTGSAKTRALHELAHLRAQVIDLEALAHHKGSAFGGIGEHAAPSQEMFENELFMQFRKTNAQFPVWLEDESQRIGSVNIPNALWQRMRQAPVLYLDVPFGIRLDYLVSTYGSLAVEELKAATLRIQKRLGGLETKTAMEMLDANDFRGAFAILLKYYDKVYDKATATRSAGTVHAISLESTDAATNAQALLQNAERLKQLNYS
jgi:tRNA 2-selenouridine synthase